MVTAEELLRAFPHLKESAARLAGQLMAGNMPPDEDLPKETQIWINRCYGRPSWPEIALDAINHIVGGYGTEAIETESWVGNYCGHIRACYVNMGDTYDATIVYDNATHEWQLTSWGDYVEELEQKGVKFK